MLPWRLIRYRPLRGGWLWDYLRHHRPLDTARLSGDAPLDVIVVLVDHFEPAGEPGPQAAVDSVAAWCEKYRTIASRHEDADGRYPQHTWFHRAEYPNFGCIHTLADACFDGYGETEFHLHHGHDTHATFTEKLRAGLEFFNSAGAMLTAEETPQQRFAYIAGNWSLDNGSRNDALSGCNTEITALRDAGCYADFTFPAMTSYAQPRKTNAIYYATDTPEPKSYDTGVDVEAGRAVSGDLMIFQGPTTVDWRAGRIEDAAVEFFSPPKPRRLDQWLRANVHVRGRPEWVFVKLHCHGMQSHEVFGGPAIDEMFEQMTTRWNRPPLRLHFATAREAYNMVKAAEAGKDGNPNDYRDFDAPRPANIRVRCDRPWQLETYTDRRVALRVLEEGPATIEFADGPLHAARGTIGRLEATIDDDRLESIEVTGCGEVEIETSDGARVVSAGMPTTSVGMAPPNPRPPVPSPQSPAPSI